MNCQAQLDALNAAQANYDNAVMQGQVLHAQWLSAANDCQIAQSVPMPSMMHRCTDATALLQAKIANFQTQNEALAALMAASAAYENCIG